MFDNDSNYLDQHFLIDDIVIKKFINICNLNKDDIVVEIGPGTGTLTKLIASKVKSLTVIEKDERLKEYLIRIPNIKIIYGNVLDIEIPKCNKIITALPYSIIEPFIYKLTKIYFKELYMIMGSTYVNNVINKKITNLSLLTNTYFNAEKYFDIEPNSFNPEPKTMSSVIKLTKKEKFNELDLIIKSMYEQSDKKIKNALMESLIKIKKITKKESKSIIKSLKLDDELLNHKFEEISNGEIKILYEKLSLLYKE